MMDASNTICSIVVDIINSALTLVAVTIALCVAIRESHLYRKNKMYSQANQIATWALNVCQNQEKMSYMAVISNQSFQPIYDVVLSVGVTHGAGPLYNTGDENNTCVTIIPPGLYTVPVPFSGDGMNMKFGISISFRDINNNYWRRDAIGHLKKTEKNPLTELCITLPAAWINPEPFPSKSK